MHRFACALPRCPRLSPLTGTLLALAALWGGLFALFPPARQDFPLNDDWAYARGVFALVRGEGLHYFGQPSMPLLGQWLWAVPFVWLLGATHAVLRFSTLILSLLGLLAFRDLLRREVGMGPSQAAFAVAVLALNPLVFLSSGTFMSDVPALTFALIALALYSRALSSGRGTTLMVAAGVALLATLTRQNAAAAPLAAALLAWCQPRWRWHPAWILAVLLPVGAGVVLNAWLGARPDAVPLYPEIPSPRKVLFLTLVVIHTLGLAALPVFALQPRPRSWPVFVLALQLLLTAAALVPDLRNGHPPTDRYPYLGNLLTPWGAFEFSNTVVAGNRPLLLDEGTRLLLTLAGCVGGAALLDRLVGAARAGVAPGLLAGFTAVHLLFLLIAPTLFDRYLIVLMPGALALAALPGIVPRWKAGLGMLAVVAVCSVGLMHDWLAWNAARWEVGRRALARGIDPLDIEGGFEWDGWYSLRGAVRGHKPILPRRLTLPFNARYFPHVSGRYALAFSVPDRADIVDSEPYALWLLPGRRRFFLVKFREGEGPARGLSFHQHGQTSPTVTLLPGVRRQRRRRGVPHEDNIDSLPTGVGQEVSSPPLDAGPEAHREVLQRGLKVVEVDVSRCQAVIVGGVFQVVGQGRLATVLDDEQNALAAGGGNACRILRQFAVGGVKVAQDEHQVEAEQQKESGRQQTPRDGCLGQAQTCQRQQGR